MGARVQGYGVGFTHLLRVQGSGFRVQGSGFRIQGSEFRVQDFGVEGLKVWGLGVEGWAHALVVGRRVVERTCCFLIFHLLREWRFVSMRQKFDSMR